MSDNAYGWLKGANDAAKVRQIDRLIEEKSAAFGFIKRVSNDERVPADLRAVANELAAKLFAAAFATSDLATAGPQGKSDAVTMHDDVTCRHQWSSGIDEDTDREIPIHCMLCGASGDI